MSSIPLPRSSTRRQLLDAGREIVLNHGFQGLTVRGIAASAGANLGSFVYHFGTRDAFVRTLLEEWYAPLLSRVAVAVDGVGTPLERLRRAILQLVDFGIEHGALVGPVMTGAAAGEKGAREFLSILAGRHPRLLLGLIGAAQAEGEIVDAEPLQVLCFVMASVGLPLLLAGAWHGPPLFGRSFSAAIGHAARDRASVVQRLDWAILGLNPRGL